MTRGTISKIGPQKIAQSIYLASYSLAEPLQMVVEGENPRALASRIIEPR